MADCITRLGGSQYINSAATGRYADHLIDELDPVRRRHATARSPTATSAWSWARARAATAPPCSRCAIPTCSASPSTIPATSTSSSATAPTSPPRSRRWRATSAPRRASSPAFRTRRASAAATGSRSSTCWRWRRATHPTPAAPVGFDLPFDTHTAELRADVWARWLAHDPVELAAAHADALRALRLYFLDCGRWDEHHLQYGDRIYSAPPAGARHPAHVRRVRRRPPERRAPL